MSGKRLVVEVVHDGGPFSKWAVRSDGPDDCYPTKKQAIREARLWCRTVRDKLGVACLLRVHNVDGTFSFGASYPVVRDKRKPGERDKG